MECLDSFGLVRSATTPHPGAGRRRPLAQPRRGVCMSSRESTAALLKACGVSGALELEVEDEQQGTRRLDFHQPFLVLGRGGGTDLPLDHPDVSQRHAYLQVLAGRVFCYDLL